MADYNSVVLVGRLTRDPEEKFTQGGTKTVRLSLAVGRSYKASDGTWKKITSFFDISVWGRQADNCLQWLHKGSSVLIGGELEQQRWQDKASGQNRSKVIVRAQRVQFLDPKGHEGGGESAPGPEGDFTADGIPTGGSDVDASQY